MNQEMTLKPCMIEAIANLEAYIEQTTGRKPSQEELAQALSKYFVLKEIREFIEMTRQE